jgi:hypothetical protein
MVKEDLTKKVATGTACWERGGVLGGGQCRQKAGSQAAIAQCSRRTGKAA